MGWRVLAVSKHHPGSGFSSGYTLSTVVVQQWSGTLWSTDDKTVITSASQDERITTWIVYSQNRCVPLCIYRLRSMWVILGTLTCGQFVVLKD